MQRLANLILLVLPPALRGNEAQNKDVAWLQYYRGAEQYRDDQWKRDIWPRIASTANLSRVLEIAPGGGRLTEMLLRHMRAGGSLIGVDKNKVAVGMVRQRFATYRAGNASSSKHAAFFANSGSYMPMVANSSIDFVFSWDCTRRPHTRTPPHTRVYSADGATHTASRVYVRMTPVARLSRARVRGSDGSLCARGHRRVRRRDR